ncbi:MAG TPA: hypothetical protein VIC03_11820 [Gemmatimonadaceae bacterium]|jgi:hypothetical protein
METAKPLARAGYLLAAALVIIPIADSALPLLPLQLTDARWRWGVVGQLSNVTLVPLLGLLLAVALAALTDSRRIRRVIGAICGIFALILAVMTVFFVIDYFHVRTLVKPQLEHNMAIASSVAFVKNLLSIITLSLLCRAGFSGPTLSAVPSQSRSPVSPASRSPLVGVSSK